MKIAILTQYYKPEMGAPQNRLLELAQGLRLNGNEMTVVTAMPNYPTGHIFKVYQHKFSVTETLDGITVRRYWLYASNSKKSLPRITSMLSFSLMSLCSLLFLRKRHLDYLIVESPPLPLCLTGWILSICTGARLVTNISDLWPMSAKELGVLSGDSFLYKVLERLESFIYKHSAFCMGQSEEIISHIKECNAKQTYLFRNGVDPARFKGIVPTPHKGIRIIYAGLLGFAQGIFNICENINFHQLGVEFHIYGDGGEKEQIETFVYSHPERGIYYHGTISREEIPQVLANADLSLVPLVKRIYGAVPSKIYESMAAGLPILFVGEGEGERIIEENELGWVVMPGKYELLKNRILYIINNPSEIKSRKKNCISCSVEKFNRPCQIKALHDFMATSLNINNL